MAMGGLGRGSFQVLLSGLPQAILMGTEKGGHCPLIQSQGLGSQTKVARKIGPGGQVGALDQRYLPLLFFGGWGSVGWDGGLRERGGNAISRSCIFHSQLKGGLVKRQRWPLKEGSEARLERCGHVKPARLDVATCSRARPTSHRQASLHSLKPSHN